MIQYRENHAPGSKASDSFGSIFKEAASSFGNAGVQIVGQSFADVLTDPALFESYTTELSKMLSADQSEVMGQLFENTRLEILRESLGGITPTASLVLPILRRFWPRLAANEVLPVEPVSKPKITIASMVPYLIDQAGVRHKLPHALVSDDETINVQGRTKLADTLINLPCAGVDLITPAGGAVRTGDYIDVDFSIVLVNADVSVAGDGSDLKDIAINAKVQTRNNSIQQVVTYKKPDGSIMTVDTLFGFIDRKTGLLTATSVAGRIKKVKIDGYLSSESNNRSEEVIFDIVSEDVDVHSGNPLVASMPAQTAQDSMAMYNLDAHMLLTDLAASTLAQKHDIEAFAYLTKMHNDNANSDEFNQYSSTFNLHAPAQFAGQPKDWREEVKRVIDYQVNSMKSDYFIQRGEARLVGNPVDTSIIHNINWIFNGNVGDENAGVNVDYSVAQYVSGNGAVRVVSTQNIRKGKLRTLFVPSQDTQVSVKYLPYAYNVFNAQDGYRVPQKSNVPGLVMFRRDAYFKSLSMVGEIVLQNNDGTLADY